MSWAEVRLSRLVVDVVDGPFGSSLTSEHYADEGARVVRLGNLGAGYFKNEKRAFIPLAHYAHLSRHNVQPGDLLVAGLGDEQNALGRACLAPPDLGPAIVKADCFRFRLATDQVLHAYAMWALNSAKVSAAVELEARGATRARATPSMIGRVHVPLPSLNEQRRIADFLDEQVSLIDRVVDLRQRQIALVAEREAVLVRQLLTGDRAGSHFATGDRWFPRLPLGWRAVRLKQHWQVIDCKHRTPVYRDVGYPVVSTGDVEAGRLDLGKPSRFVDEVDYADLADGPRRPRRGDIVYGRNASVGTACYVDTERPFTMGQDVCRITRPGGDQLFLAHVLNYLVAPQLDYEKVGSTFSRINVAKILNLVVPLPSTEEEMSSVASAVDALVADFSAARQNLRRSLALLRERKQALISAAVTGQFDISAASGVA